jgi:uncharacterized protein
MNKHHSINYLEIPVKSLARAKDFFGGVFGWQFEDYGPEYSCFIDAGLTGGFYQADLSFNLDRGSPLIVIYSEDLCASEQAICDLGGTISKAIFSFPGGRRFHFLCPNGNEYAVWSE